MRRLLLICALLAGGAFAQAPSVGAGTLSGTITCSDVVCVDASGFPTIGDLTQAGNVGDPYEGNGAPSSPTQISTCQRIVANNQNIQLTADIGSDGTAKCLRFAGAAGKTMSVDLNGHTVTGTVGLNNSDLFWSGITVYNGTITCTVVGSPNVNGVYGCIDVQMSSGAGSIAQKNRLHHLTIHNTADPGGNANRALSFIGSAGTTLGTSGCGGPLQLKCDFVIDHITSDVGVGDTATRMSNFYVDSSGHSFAFHHNKVTCVADSGACQGFSLLSAQHIVLFQNDAEMLQNTSTAGTDRAFLCDSGASYCDVFRNYVNANNNRAFRTRDSYHDNFHHNYVDSILTITGDGTLHYADEDSCISTGNVQPCGNIENVDANVYANTFSLAGNSAVINWMRNGYNVQFHNNKVIPNSKTGYLGQLDATFSAGSGNNGVSEMTLFDNTLGGWTGTSSNLFTGVTNTTFHLCNTGTGVAGTGSSNTTVPNC